MGVELIIKKYMEESEAAKALLLFGKTAKIRGLLEKNFPESVVFFATEYIERAKPKLQDSKPFCHKAFAQTMILSDEGRGRKLLVIDQMNELAGRYSTQCFLGKAIMAHLKLGHYVVLIAEGEVDEIDEMVTFMVSRNLLTINEVIE